jgi:hypothetical protein
MPREPPPAAPLHVLRLDKMADLLRVKPIFALFCDDIRHESNGKQILIGVYTGDILPAQFPAVISISIWVAFERINNMSGELPIEFRVINTRGNSLGYGSAKLYLTDDLHDGVITLPGLPLQLTQPDTLTFQLKQGDDPWKSIRTTHVRLPPTSATSPAPPSSRPPPAESESSSAPEPSRRVRPVPRRRT